MGKLDLLFSHVFAKILYRAISGLKCMLQSLGDQCKGGGSDSRRFFSLQVVKWVFSEAKPNYRIHFPDTL